MSVNAAVVSPAAKGFAVLYAGSGGSGWSGTTSHINFNAGQTASNGAVVTLGPFNNGQDLAAVASTTGTLYLDATGYFIP